MKKLLSLVIVLLMTLSLTVPTFAATGTSFDAVLADHKSNFEIPIGNADINEKILALDYDRAHKAKDGLYHVWLTGDRGGDVLSILLEEVSEPLSMNLWETESKMAASVNGNTRVEILEMGDRMKYDVEVIQEDGHMVIVEFVLSWDN